MYLIILAAGKSKRIGGGDKAFLKYKDKTFIENIIEKISDKVKKILIVSGNHNYKSIKNKLNNTSNIIIIKNTKYHLGQIYSVKLAIRYINENLKPDHIMIHLIDQPHIKRTTYLKMIKFFNSKKEVVIPAFFIKKENKLKRGHPVIIPKKYLNLVLKSPYSQGLHWFIHHKDVKTYNIILKDISVIQDIDTLHDFKIFLY